MEKRITIPRIDLITASLPRGNNLIKAADSLEYLANFDPFINYLARKQLNQDEIDATKKILIEASKRCQTVELLRKELRKALTGERVELFPDADHLKVPKTKLLLAIFIEPTTARDYRG